MENHRYDERKPSLYRLRSTEGIARIYRAPSPNRASKFQREYTESRSVSNLQISRRETLQSVNCLIQTPSVSVALPGATILRLHCRPLVFSSFHLHGGISPPLPFARDPDNPHVETMKGTGY